MELKAYLRTLMGKWWIVLLVFLITYAATLALTITQKPVYQAKATFVVKLGTPAADDRELTSAVDILSRRPEIGTTYTMVATSRLIKGQAVGELGLSEEQRGDVSVSSQLVPGTNVLEITTRAHDPVLAREFTNVVGAKTVAYVQDLYDTYTLEPLDEATAPGSPISPNRLLNLILGGIVGLVLGSGLAFLSAYLQAPTENVTNFGIIDDETGVYNKRYFMLRLRQEMSRAKRTKDPLSVALINLNHNGELDDASGQLRREAMRRVAMRLKPYLRDEDVMARFSDMVFAFLLPDMPGETAEEMVERLQTVIAATPLEIETSGVKLNLHGSAGVAVYPDKDPDKDIEPHELLAQATRALEDAESATAGTIYPFPQNRVQYSAKHRKGRAQ